MIIFTVDPLIWIREAKSDTSKADEGDVSRVASHVNEEDDTCILCFLLTSSTHVSIDLAVDPLLESCRAMFAASDIAFALSSLPSHASEVRVQLRENTV